MLITHLTANNPKELAMKNKEPAYNAAKIISAIKRNAGTKQDAEKALGQSLDDDLWVAMFPQIIQKVDG